MKKIMFNDEYGLTDAVLQGRKTMTRRIVPNKYIADIERGLKGVAFAKAYFDGRAYRADEVVAVAQSYLSIHEEMMNGDYSDGIYDIFRWAEVDNKKGWNNKMFVRPFLMPHQIRITDIKIERLQDISDEDCMREGLVKGMITYGIRLEGGCLLAYSTPREAFADLIDAVSGKGTWERNPYVFAYTFKLLK